MDIHKKSLVVNVLLATAAMYASLFTVRTGIALADDTTEANQLVERAQETLQGFLCDDSMGAFRDLLPKAHAVLIVPSLLKGAFIVGASGGSGVVLVRDKAGGAWTQPAFYTVGSASIGPQIGGQASEVVLLAMTERGVSSFYGNSIKVGADVGAAAGPVGIGVSAATANLSVDILAFSRAKGLYGGVSLDGAVIAVRDGLNRAFYGRAVSPADILVKYDVSNPDGTRLSEAVAKAASEATARRDCTGGSVEKGKTPG